MVLNLQSELQFRLSSAADFLEVSWKGDNFAHAFEQDKGASKKYHLTHNLQAISLLITLAEFLGRDRLREIADEAFGLLHTFSTDNTKFLIYDEKSQLIWNSMASIIHLKRNETEEARAFASSIQECIGRDSVSSVYPPDFEQPPGWYAEAMLALLLLHGKTQEEHWADSAAYIGHLLLSQGILPNHYEVWAYTLLHNVEQDDRYLKRAKKQVLAFQKPVIKSMTSLFAASAQQAFFAAYPHEAWLASDRKKANKLHLQVLNQQVALQVDKDKSFGWTPAFYGAFVLRKTRPTIRLDYITQNGFAMMQYLSHLTNQKIPAII